jgi:hypothetical protein
MVEKKRKKSLRISMNVFGFFYRRLCLPPYPCTARSAKTTIFPQNLLAQNHLTIALLSWLYLDSFTFSLWRKDFTLRASASNISHFAQQNISLAQSANFTDLFVQQKDLPEV